LIIFDHYASWLNHQWLLNHIKLISVLKPTDRNDPEYSQKIKLWQEALAVPKQMRNSIAVQNSIISLKIFSEFERRKFLI